MKNTEPCLLCGGTKRLTLLGGILMDTRLRESFHHEKCPHCDGTGVRTQRRWRDWEAEQERLRMLYAQTI